jgi:hypothetical protein
MRKHYNEVAAFKNLVIHTNTAAVSGPLENKTAIKRANPMKTAAQILLTASNEGSSEQISKERDNEGKAGLRPGQSPYKGLPVITLQVVA